MPLAFALALGLSLIPVEASAAALRSSAGVLGGLALLTALVLLRDWPIELAGSLWATAALVGVALWFLRSRRGQRWWAAALPARMGAEAGARSATLVARRGTTSLPSIADHDRVLESARHCFVTLQAAWDAADIEALRAHTTPEMLQELVSELPLRGAEPNRTEVLELDAALLGFEEFGPRYLASIEFSGRICESALEGEVPFRELWMLTCAKSEPREWRLARHQVLL